LVSLHSFDNPFLNTFTQYSMTDASIPAFLFHPIFVAFLLFIAGCIGYFWGKQSKYKNQQSQIRQLERERNDLFVQCSAFRELIDNQELDIKRYAAELQLFSVMEQEWCTEREILQIAFEKNANTPADADEGKDIMIKLLRSDLEQTRRSAEAALAKLKATEQVLDFLRSTEKRAV
jgi:hypothetical protein